MLRAARNNIGCFSHVTKLANLRVENTSFQSNTKLLIFCRGRVLLMDAALLMVIPLSILDVLMTFCNIW